MASRSFNLNLQQEGTNKTIKIPVSQEAAQYSYTLNLLGYDNLQGVYCGEFDGREPIIIGVESTKSVSGSTTPVGVEYYYNQTGLPGQSRSSITNYLKHYLPDSCTHIVTIYPDSRFEYTRGTATKFDVNQNESGKKVSGYFRYPKHTIQAGPGDHNVIYLKPHQMYFSPRELELPIDAPTSFFTGPPSIKYEPVFPTFCPMELEVNEVSGSSINATLRLDEDVAIDKFTSPYDRDPVSTPSPLHVGNVLFYDGSSSSSQNGQLITLIPIYIYLS